MGVFTRTCGLFLNGLTISGLLACTNGEPTATMEVPKTLIEASTEVVFASADALGAHQLRTVLNTQEFHNGALSSEHQEIQIIDWVDWDNWHVQRSVDDEIVEDVWIVAGRTFENQRGNILQKRDGEPYRVQLRNTWNQWERIIRPFEPFITWKKIQEENISERRSHVYQAQFDRTQKSASRLSPTSINASVWVDEATAVRLLGSLEGTLQNGEYEKRLNLKVERLDINSEVVLQRLQTLIQD